MGKSITTTLYVGLDVHKGSIDIAVAEAGRDGEVRHVGSIGGDLAGLDKALRKLISRGSPLHIVYEASPRGFVIWRHLRAQGLTCEVAAPSSIPKRSGDRVKTDRRDAILLARLARAGEVTAVRVPRRGRRSRTRSGACPRGRGNSGAGCAQRSSACWPWAEDRGSKSACADLDGPRGRSSAKPRPARLSLQRAIQHGVSSKSYWQMARTLAVQQALSNAWLKAQGLVSVKDLWCKAQDYTS